MTLQELREKRSKAVIRMRTLTELAANEQRDLSDSEDEQFGQLKSEIGKLDRQVERAEYLAEAERSMDIDEDSPRLGRDGSFEQACRNFSVTKAIGHQLAPSQVDAGREIEISQELSRRSGMKPEGILVPHEIFLERRDVTTGGSGGNLVDTSHRADLMIDRLRAALKVQALGATVLNGLVGNQDIPRLTGSATGYWAAEHDAITESDHTFDTVQLQPKTVGAEVEYSRRMLINAVPAVEQLVRMDLASVLATAIDYQAINGDGQNDDPTGVINATDVNAVAINGAPTWADILECISLVSADNALVENMGWLISPHAVKTLRSTVRVDSTDSRFIMDAPNELAGYRVEQTTQLPDDPYSSPVVPGTLLFGNWADLLIGYWSAVDILVNPYHSDVYSKGGVKINALQDVDVAVRHGQSFAKGTGMTL